MTTESTQREQFEAKFAELGWSIPQLGYESEVMDAAYWGYKAGANSIPAGILRDAEEALLTELRCASILMENLPKLPGYSGSILMIDATEAKNIEKVIDEAIEAIDQDKSNTKGDE